MENLIVRFGGNPNFLVLNNSVHISPEECALMAKDFYAVMSYGNYTLKRFGNELVLFNYKEIEFELSANLEHLFTVLSKVKVPVTLDLSKFQKSKCQPFEVKSWAKLLFSQNLDTSAHVTIKRIMREKPDLLGKVKEFLSSYIESAKIYADYWGKYDLAFNGRYDGGCGFNGACIYHENSNTMSVHT